MIGAMRPPPPTREGFSPMRTEQCLPAGAMSWRQVGPWWAPCWELWSDERRLAHLRRAGWAGRVLEVTTADGIWRLRVLGFLGSRQVMREGDATPVLSFRSAWFRGGRIERRDGTFLRWKPALFASGGSMTREDGGEALSVRRLGRGLRMEGETRLEESMRRAPDAEALVLLAWWLLLEARSHAAHG
jgi:hypothetical protein